MKGVRKKPVNIGDRKCVYCPLPLVDGSERIKGYVTVDGNCLRVTGGTTIENWEKQAQNKDNRIYRVPFLHFWRSFDKVCRDGHSPERFVKLSGSNMNPAYLDDGYLEGSPEKYRIYHMGYAQPDKYIQYKMDVQAHHNEWRQDWYFEKWSKNAQTDVHPVVFDFWNTEDYDKNKMPEELKKNIYHNQSLII